MQFSYLPEATPNQFTFRSYGGYVFFNYYVSRYVYLLALDIDQLETASWANLIEVDKFSIDENF